MLKNACWVFEEERRTKAVLGVCKGESERPAERTRWFKNSSCRSKQCFAEKMA